MFISLFGSDVFPNQKTTYINNSFSNKVKNLCLFIWRMITSTSITFCINANDPLLRAICNTFLNYFRINNSFVNKVKNSCLFIWRMTTSTSITSCINANDALLKAICNTFLNYLRTVLTLIIILSELIACLSHASLTKPDSLIHNLNGMSKN